MASPQMAHSLPKYPVSSEFASEFQIPDFTDDAIASVEGNAPPEIKQVPLKWLAVFRRRKVSFANSIAHRVKVTEVSILKSPDDEHRIEGKVVCEIDVTQDAPYALSLL
ncbi:hypothetical protein H0H93_008533 [Arthromyces matolae]|nr:hypothetical protein H0H93_008533 [Arthromyces matolae]